MTRPARCPLLLLAIALLLPSVAAAQNEEQTRARLTQESDPIDRAKLQIRLAGFILDGARKHYSEGAYEKGLAAVNEMLALVEKAEKELFSTGHNPRKRPRGFKDAEIKLRELSRRLEDLRLALPTGERGEIEKVAERLVEIRENLLHGLMSVKKR